MASPRPLRPRQGDTRPLGTSTGDSGQRGDAGNRRLHERWITFNLRKKRPVIANVAIARELAGWCWSLDITTRRVSRVI